MPDARRHGPVGPRARGRRRAGGTCGEGERSGPQAARAYEPLTRRLRPEGLGRIPRIAPAERSEDGGIRAHTARASAASEGTDALDLMKITKVETLMTRQIAFLHEHPVDFFIFNFVLSSIVYCNRFTYDVQCLGCTQNNDIKLIIQRCV